MSLYHPGKYEQSREELIHSLFDWQTKYASLEAELAQARQREAELNEACIELGKEISVLRVEGSKLEQERDRLQEQADLRAQWDIAQKSHRHREDVNCLLLNENTRLQADLKTAREAL